MAAIKTFSSFSVGSGTVALATYDSSMPEIYDVLTGKQLQIVAGSDWLTSSGGTGSFVANRYNGVADFGKQRATGQVYVASGANAGLALRCSSGGDHYCFRSRGTGSARLIRVVSGVETALATYNDVATTAGNYYAMDFTCETIDASTVQLTCIYNGVSHTFNDTNAARLLTGTPGFSIESNGRIQSATFYDFSTSGGLLLLRRRRQGSVEV